jgi:hypothetical protein
MVPLLLFLLKLHISIFGIYSLDDVLYVSALKTIGYASTKIVLFALYFICSCIFKYIETLDYVTNVTVQRINLLVIKQCVDSSLTRISTSL